MRCFAPTYSIRNLLGSENATYSMALVEHQIGNRVYELSNHLGNVLTTISDKPLPYDDDADDETDWFLADIRTAQDYSPFGVTLSGRNFSVSEGYRYGFNGMEKDDEVKGSGNSYDFGARMLDPRLGRWLTIDPLQGKYAGMSPYNVCNNNPIIFDDPTGKSGELTIVRNPDGTEKAVITAHIAFYTGDASLNGKVDHERIVSEMMSQFNGKGSITVNGKPYPVELSLTSEFVYNEAFDEFSYIGVGNSSEPDKVQMALFHINVMPSQQKDLKYNFFRVEKGGVDVSFGEISGQRAFLLYRQIGKGSKTPLHEFLHTLGLDHPIVFNEELGEYVYEGVWSGDGAVPIMYPNGAKDKSGNPIVPNSRVVTPETTSELSNNIGNEFGTTVVGSPRKNGAESDKTDTPGSILLDRSGNGQGFILKPGEAEKK